MEKIKQKLKHMYLVGRYPERDWARLLVLFCIFAIMIGGWSTLFYFQVNADVASDSTIAQAGKALSQRKERELQDILAKYDDKVIKYKQLQDHLPIIAPPVATTTSPTASSTNIEATSTVTKQQ